jgi:hypothetical protein
MGGKWTPTYDFPYNSTSYSITTPCFCPEGTTLIFASNMPGGYGGTDLYRSVLLEGKWSKPKNLGRGINSKGNEVYPFVSESGIFSLHLTDWEV